MFFEYFTCVGDSYVHKLTFSLVGGDGATTLTTAELHPTAMVVYGSTGSNNLSLKAMFSGALHILLADDDEDDRVLFTHALNELKMDIIVHTVKDGFELMDYLEKKANDLPQLLFLDLNMPRKNGFECLKEIRSNLKMTEMAIAILSTSLAEKDIEETFLSGANVYINKPKNFDDLKSVLNKVVFTVRSYQYALYDKSNFLLRV